jgi:hypothetical protein
MVLNELKRRHELRRITNMPIERLLGPDQMSYDIEQLFDMVDDHREILRDTHAFLRSHPRYDDAQYADLMVLIERMLES